MWTYIDIFTGMYRMRYVKIEDSYIDMNKLRKS